MFSKVILINLVLLLTCKQIKYEFANKNNYRWSALYIENYYNERSPLVLCGYLKPHRLVFYFIRYIL